MHPQCEPIKNLSLTPKPPHQSLSVCKYLKSTSIQVFTFEFANLVLLLTGKSKSYVVVLKMGTFGLIFGVLFLFNFNDARGEEAIFVAGGVSGDKYIRNAEILTLQDSKNIKNQLNTPGKNVIIFLIGFWKVVHDGTLEAMLTMNV